MRKKAIRSEILRTLKENPDGLTAEQIFNKKRRREFISNARHIGNLIRGMKEVRKGDVQDRVMDGFNNRTSMSYKVNRYYYDEEGAEV